MLFLNREAVRESLPMPQAVAAMRRAFAQMAAGDAHVPARTVLALPADGGDFLVMPALTDGGGAVGAKLLTLLPDNPRRERPLIHALMALFDGRTGEPVAIVIAVERGLMSWEDVYAELGELAAGQKPGRRGDEEVTLFKSVGLALQDVAAAAAALENARRLRLGTELS